MFEREYTLPHSDVKPFSTEDLVSCIQDEKSAHSFQEELKAYAEHKMAAYGRDRVGAKKKFTQICYIKSVSNITAKQLLDSKDDLIKSLIDDGSIDINLLLYVKVFLFLYDDIPDSDLPRKIKLSNAPKLFDNNFISQNNKFSSQKQKNLQDFCTENDISIEALKAYICDDNGKINENLHKSLQAYVQIENDLIAYSQFRQYLGSNKIIPTEQLLIYPNFDWRKKNRLMPMKLKDLVNGKKEQFIFGFYAAAYLKYHGSYFKNAKEVVPFTFQTITSAIKFLKNVIKNLPSHDQEDEKKNESSIFNFSRKKKENHELITALENFEFLSDEMQKKWESNKSRYRKEDVILIVPREKSSDWESLENRESYKEGEKAFNLFYNEILYKEIFPPAKIAFLCGYFFDSDAYRFLRPLGKMQEFSEKFKKPNLKNLSWNEVEKDYNEYNKKYERQLYLLMHPDKYPPLGSDQAALAGELTQQFQEEKQKKAEKDAALFNNFRELFPKDPAEPINLFDFDFDNEYISWCYQKGKEAKDIDVSTLTQELEKAYSGILVFRDQQRAQVKKAMDTAWIIQSKLAEKGKINSDALNRKWGYQQLSSKYLLDQKEHKHEKTTPSTTSSTHSNPSPPSSPGTLSDEESSRTSSPPSDFKLAPTTDEAPFIIEIKSESESESESKETTTEPVFTSHDTVTSTTSSYDKDRDMLIVAEPEETQLLHPEEIKSKPTMLSKIGNWFYKNRETFKTIFKVILIAAIILGLIYTGGLLSVALPAFFGVTAAPTLSALFGAGLTAFTAVGAGLGISGAAAVTLGNAIGMSAWLASTLSGLAILSTASLIVTSLVYKLKAISDGFKRIFCCRKASSLDDNESEFGNDTSSRGAVDQTATFHSAPHSPVESSTGNKSRRGSSLDEPIVDLVGGGSTAAIIQSGDGFRHRTHSSGDTTPVDTNRTGSGGPIFQRRSSKPQVDPKVDPVVASSTMSSNLVPSLSASAALD